MSRASAMGEYLRARRALVDPQTAGFSVDRHRRVAGLRREEVAELAGISPEYYLRLEQGRDHLPSTQVLNALATALQLDAVAREYLDRLARPRVRTDSDAGTFHGDLESVQALFSQWTSTAAFVSNRNLDIVQANALADEIGQGHLSAGSNSLLALFEPAVRAHHSDWEATVAQVIAALRMASDPLDPRVQEIIGNLSIMSPDFRRIWARQDVAVPSGGPTMIHVEPFGDVQFVVQNFAVAGHDGLTMTTIFAAPESPAVSVMAYLAARSDARRATSRPGPKL